MKTTLIIDDSVMARLREVSARTGVSISEIVESALRRHLDRPEAAKAAPKLPAFHGGGLLVDISSRKALLEVMEAREDEDR